MNYMNCPGLVAQGTVSQYRVVQLDSNYDFHIKAISNANAQRPIGILQNDPSDEEPADVAMLGMARAKLAGTVSCGSTLISNNSGNLISDEEETSAADVHHVADALEDGVSGDVIWVWVHTPVYVGIE